MVEAPRRSVAGAQGEEHRGPFPLPHRAEDGQDASVSWPRWRRGCSSSAATRR